MGMWAVFYRKSRVADPSLKMLLSGPFINRIVGSCPGMAPVQKQMASRISFGQLVWCTRCHIYFHGLVTHQDAKRFVRYDSERCDTTTLTSKQFHYISNPWDRDENQKEPLLFYHSNLWKNQKLLMPEYHILACTIIVGYCPMENYVRDQLMYTRKLHLSSKKSLLP